jgi:signal peptidase I
MRTWLRIVAWLTGVVGVVALVLYAFVFDVWTVPNDDPVLAASVEPTLSAGDVVLVSRQTSVARGNLLRCADPQAPGRFVIGRAMARFGDKLELREEVVTLDGRRTPSPRRCDPPTIVIHDPQTNDDVSLACCVEEFGEMTYASLRSLDHPEPPTRGVEVEAGRWFLVSDDRHVHLDSRDFGQIDPAACQHIVFRLVGAAGFGDRNKRLSIIW